LLIIPGRPALSAARKASVLTKVREVSPHVTSLEARWVHMVVAGRELTADELTQLGDMLSYGPIEPPVRPSRRLETVETVSFVVTPRIGTVSPWSSKATDIAHVCGLSAVTRIERGTEWTFVGDAIDVAKVSALLSDRMTESVIMRESDLAKVVAFAGSPRPLQFVQLGNRGVDTLREASTRLGLALADDEIEYLVARYKELGRDPTDVELMMFAQANSEHCRHKIFNADWYVSGEKQERSLFQWIKTSTAAAPAGVLSAYKDNAAVIEGSTAERFFPDADGVYRGHVEPAHILGKVETHNHPTAISPFPGAATGSGGEIRDEGATGRGAKPKAGLVGFTVSDLRIPEQLEPWERDEWIGSPARIATALDIMIEGPLGGAAFNNEFGRPAILGYFRTFELGDRGYHKPVMLAGGVGTIRAQHVQKAKVPAGAALIVLGGPAFLIGLGGGAASSLAQGASAEDLDFASVQRDNAEIQRRCQEVIDSCWAMGDRNPILSIHDVGAGGLSNAMPELVHDAGLGAMLGLRKIPTGEPDLAPLELWCNEAQERYVMAVGQDRVADFAALCERERAPWAQLGTATPDGRLTVADERGGPPPVDLPLEVVLGKPPRMTRRAEPLPSPRRALDLAGASIADALDRVLGLPTVADKTFLISIGDRTVGGMVSRDPMIGRYQVPVADCALTLAGFDTYAGEVMAIGERPPVALLDAAAASRLAIAEAITNLAGAPIGPLSRIKLSCNWMAAAGHPGEDARLYAGVRAAAETAVALGIAIPVGKDSMSMRTQWDGKAVVSPVTLVVTGFGPVTDVRKNVTPDLRGTGELLLVDLGAGKGRLGASCLAQVFGQLGDTPPDLDDPVRLRAFFDTMQTFVADGKLLAYHDRSDGGAIVSALEMAFAAGLGLELDVTPLAADPFRALFAEELGAIIEVAREHVDHVRTAFTKHAIAVHAIGRAVAGDHVRVSHAGALVLDASRSELRARWSHVTHQIARRRDDSSCADEEHATRIDPTGAGLAAKLTFDPTQDVAAPFIAKGARPRVAILREQGVNGQIEMAGAFTRAGFDAVDIHMTDLIEGRADLADCRGAIACGGFSFGDVLGAGRGWAATFRYNARAQSAIRRFVDRSDTFVLGVCNGCQMVADLAPDLVPATKDLWPRFVRNRSERFEARLVTLRIEHSPSLFFTGMTGSRIPIANAHGEGRAEFASTEQLEALERGSLVSARFVDGNGDITELYPANPNGSPNGIAAVTTADGRVTVIMPHPERVFRTVQLSWHPSDWGEDSPWMRMFRNARAWVA
jgi:phosphoribosylformylglycinamidine synthase